MCSPVDGDSWVTYSLGRDMNEERLKQNEELELLTGLTAYLGNVKQVVSDSDPSSGEAMVESSVADRRLEGCEVNGGWTNEGIGLLSGASVVSWRCPMKGSVGRRGSGKNEAAAAELGTCPKLLMTSLHATLTELQMLLGRRGPLKATVRSARFFGCLGVGKEVRLEGEHFAHGRRAVMRFGGAFRREPMVNRRAATRANVEEQNALATRTDCSRICR